MRPVATPSVPRSHDLRPPFTPLERAHDEFDPSLTYKSDDVSSITLSIMNTIAVHRGLRRIQLCRTVHDDLQSPPLFGDDTALSAILASNDPREQKSLGRQVRHFDSALWIDKCEAIALRGNLAKFSQNEEMRVALENTGARRIAEASPHGKVWGIGLISSHPRAASPILWCRLHLLGQAGTHTRYAPPEYLWWHPARNHGPKGRGYRRYGL